MVNLLGLWTAVIPFAVVGSPLLAQATSPSTSDDIVVTAAPAGQQQLIDRKIYLVKNNAEAQTESGLDVLRHVPSITVTAKDQIQLLGDSGVKVMIDGHPISGGANAIKTLPAARIAKIEVTTNPSAAFSAEGTGGVINIVTRHDAAAGLAGSATIAAGSFGATDMQLSPTYSAGRWTVALTLNQQHDLNDYGGSRERTAVDPTLDLDQTKRNSLNIDYFSGRLDFAFNPRTNTKWTLSVGGDDIDARFDDRLISRSRGSDRIPASEDDVSIETRTHYVATAGYNWTGRRQGESLNISANYDALHFDRPSTIVDLYDSGTQRSDVVRSGLNETGELKLDYVHPLSKADTLSLGGALTNVRESETNGILISSASSLVQPSIPMPLKGRWTTIAAYGTLQFPVGKWTILPGLRAEEHIRKVSSLGMTAGRDGLRWFPSLHVARKLTKRLELAANYSRRIQWPELLQLDPAIRYSDILTGDSGNPLLRPQMTNTVETSLSFTPGKQSLSLKLYDRETRDTFAYSALIQPDGVSITTPINGGHSRKRGGELAVSGPIVKGLRYSASTNFGVRRTEVVESGRLTNFDQFAYSGNLQIEYQDKADGRPTANHFALEAQYGGPTRSYQRRTSSWMDTTLRWTHSYSSRLSSVVKISDLFLSDRDDTILYGTDYTQVDRSGETHRRVMISLVSKLGRGN